MNAQALVDLIKALAWPLTTIVLVVVLHRPLAELVRAIGQRASKLKILQVEIELGQMVPASASLLTSIQALQQAVVQNSGSKLIVAGVTKSASSDYAVVSLGADTDQAWLTSRLFLLAALLERNRVVRCIVFTGERGSFIGAAAPRDIRGVLGARFPEYEQALLGAYGSATTSTSLGDFRNGDLSENALTLIAQSFLQNPLVSVFAPPATLTGWVYFDRTSKPNAGPSTWELADWITAAALKAMLSYRLSTGTVIGIAGAPGSEDTTRAIVQQTGPFVALVKTSGEFVTLCDRTLITERVARGQA